jgi:hypothetical protein
VEAAELTGGCLCGEVRLAIPDDGLRRFPESQLG